MVLPSLFSKNTSTPDTSTKLFLALLLTDSTIQSGFWEVSQQSITMRQKSSVFNYEDIPTLLVETDKALQELGKASENVEEIIFGLEFNWVDDKGIVDLKKPLLKKLTKELSLKPVGFVVSTEALFHSLTADEPQLSTLLIQYAVDYITVSIVNRGKLINSERVGRSEDPGADIQEATARLLANQESPVLPPKAHLVSPMVSTAELKELKSKLAEFDWKQVNPKIDHQPVVEILDESAMIEAVIQEGGKAVADAQGYSISGNLEKKVEQDPEMAQRATSMQSSDEAFVPPQFDNAVAVTDSAESIEETLHGVEHQDPEQHMFADEFSSPTDPSMHPAAAHQSQSPKSEKKNPFAGLFKTPQGEWAGNHLTFIIGGFASGLLALLIIGYVSIISAKTVVVDLKLAAKTVANEVSITLDPSIDASSPEELLLKADLITSTFSESKTIDTTGVELVGDKASGTVTITNKTDDAVTIAAGTQLVGGGVTFSLDEEIRVASSSVSENDEGQTRTFGKTDASVTAVKIGAEGNIASGVKLSVGTYGESSIEAESKNAFDGGSSREVRVYSKEDQEVLLAEVKKMILEKAEKEFRDNSDAGMYTIPTGELAISDAEYDAEIGDEVSSVTLTLEADVSAVTYLTEDVKSLVGFALKDQIPDGYELSDKEPSILSQADDEAAAEENQVVLSTNISAQALPTYDEQAFKNEISGQSPSSAEAILRGKAQIEEATVQIKPSYARFISGSVPKKVDKITFTIVN